MKKIESEYKKEYGNIPRDDFNRYLYLLNSLNLSRKSYREILPELKRIQNISWKKLEFTIYLLPKATPRPRHNSISHIFYVKGAKDNSEIFSKFMEKQNLPKIITPCKFFCTSYLPLPKSMRGKEKILAELGLIRPISKPDWDNVGKAYSDMIQGSLLYDDSLIIEGVSKKFYSVKPRIEIVIEYMESFDSLYNKNKLGKKVKL